MNKEKNTWKKSDANGNKLSEEIGEGLNFDHPSPEIKKMLNDRLECLVNIEDKKEFKKYCKPYGGMSKVLQDYINHCINK